MRLSYQEAIALVLAGLLLARTLDERNPHVIAALRRLATTLPDFPSVHLKRAAERVEAYHYNSAQVAILETIAEGWGSGRKVKIAYRSPRNGELRYRVIAPYALEPTSSGIYIICHDKWADDIRTFKLARLESAQLSDEPYTIPPDFDPEAHLASSWLKEPLPWINSTPLKGDAAEAVARLKEKPGKDLVVLGSGVLVQSLMRHNLVDEYILLDHPLVLGSGRRLFSDGSPYATFRLVDTRTTTTGVVIATYQPAEPAAGKTT